LHTALQQNLILNSNFNDKNALNLYQMQQQMVPIYAQFISHLPHAKAMITDLCSIPYLPIEVFKAHKVINLNKLAQVTFKSSGTTLALRSQHLVADANAYLQNTQDIFEQAYGPIKDFHILALLPNYVQQGDSSLVYMVDHFCKLGAKHSGFYLENTDALYHKILQLIGQKEKVMLFGVTYALLNFAEKFTLPKNNFITVMETGGMKGRGKELTRTELHLILNKSFGTASIHSEYGMTELLSQAYSKGNGIFEMNSQLKVLVRDVNDPFNISLTGKGALNVIDLANVDSCAFIATADQGEVFEDGTFTVLGRLDYSDVRGCSQLTL
jgi:hypothetical protein